MANKETNKEKVDESDEETETEIEVKSKNTPAITDYRHRCCERQQNENLRDYNFKMSHHCCQVKTLYLQNVSV